MGLSTRVVGISGSPRPNGRTTLALLIALEAAKREGVETQLISLADLKIEPCIGCVSEDLKKCKFPCVIEDDARLVYNAILESHGIILATPIYWYNMSGLMKNLIDRLTVFENMIHIDGRSWMEGKAVGFIAIGDDTGCIAVIQNLMAILNSMGALIPPWALAYHSSQESIEKNKRLVLDLANLGRAVAIAAKILSGRATPPSIWYRGDSEYEKVAEEALSKAKKVWSRLEGKVRVQA